VIVVIVEHLIVFLNNPAYASVAYITPTLLICVLLLKTFLELTHKR
jgi:hypothetical protein